MRTTPTPHHARYFVTFVGRVDLYGHNSLDFHLVRLQLRLQVLLFLLFLFLLLRRFMSDNGALSRSG